MHTALLGELAGALLPGDGDFPSASTAGVAAAVVAGARGRRRVELARALDGVGGIEVGEAADGSPCDDGPAACLRALAAADPAAFATLRELCFYAYYASPQALAALRVAGHDVADAPLPDGYALAPFHPATDLPDPPRGTYVPTAAVRPVKPPAAPALSQRARAAQEPTRGGTPRSRRPKAGARDEPADAVIVGSGMAGAVMALRLARAGVRVTCLEQGPWDRPGDYPHFGPDYELRRAQDWSTAPAERERPSDYPVSSDAEGALMWSGVGGSTVHYTAVWPRMRPSDFRRGTQHGLAPDWPLTYEELAPHYERNDATMGVSGRSGDPAWPPRCPRGGPPVPPGGTGRRAIAGLRSLGWHWWPLDLAILTSPRPGRPACNHCGNCQSGCPRGSLASTSFTHWPRALRAGAHLRTGCRAEQIVLDGRGRAAGVQYLDVASGRRAVQPASTVVVCANGIGTPRLLLASAQPGHPGGLANGSDQVGRNLMHHGVAVVEAWVDEPLESHKGATGGAIGTAQFAETDPDRGFVNGFTMVCGSRLNGPGHQANGSHSGNVAPWGPAHHDWMRDHFDHGLCLTITGEDLPVATNRVTLDEATADPWGMPGARMAYEAQPNDRRLVEFGIGRALELAGALGAVETRVNRFAAATGEPSPPAWHLMGTARMGEDRETSVTDRWHEAWEVPGLYVCDGSSLPSSGGVNPTSTIGALAERGAQELVRRARGMVSAA